MLKNNNHAINKLLKLGNLKLLTDALANLSPFALSNLISSKSFQQQLQLFKALNPTQAAETFDFLPLHIQKQLLQALSKEQAASLLNTLSPDDRTQFLEELPRETIDELVKLLPREEQILTLSLLGYPEGSVGRLMTPDYIAVKLDWTVEKVLEHIRAYGHDSETIDMIYVIDDAGKLLDDIKLKQFLFVDRYTRVQQISDQKFVALMARSSEEAAINLFANYNRLALPVIDTEGILLGIVTIDDILRLSNEEATKDIQKMGGTEELDEPYMQAPFLTLMNKRARWLVILFIGEMLTATVLGYFEDEISQAVVLALFLPLIISSGGNAGSQASTLVVRAMALDEITISDWWRVVKREVLSGLFLGIVLGTIGFMRVSLWSAFSNIYGEHWLLVATTIALSLVGVVMWGTLSGAILPLILKRLGTDPAVSSAPFVATLSDVTGLIIYFLIAMAVLHGTLL